MTNESTVNPLQIGIVGNGVIGSIIGYYLLSSTSWKQTSSTLTFFNRSELKTLPSLKNKSGEQYVFNEDFDSVSNIKNYELDVLVIPVKCYQVETLMRSISNLISPSTTILLLQNGLGGAEVIRQFSTTNPLLVGITTDAGYKESNGTIRHTAIGNMQFGWFDKTKPESYQNIENLILDSHPNGALAKQIHASLFEKVAVNAVINPLCATKDIKNGELMYFSDEVDELYEEVWRAIEVFKRQKNLVLDKRKLRKTIQEVIALTALNSCSMREDILNGRKTEVEGILGYLLHSNSNVNLPLMQKYYKEILAKEAR